MTVRNKTRNQKRKASQQARRETVNNVHHLKKQFDEQYPENIDLRETQMREDLNTLLVETIMPRMLNRPFEANKKLVYPFSAYADNDYSAKEAVKMGNHLYANPGKGMCRICYLDTTVTKQSVFISYLYTGDDLYVTAAPIEKDTKAQTVRVRFNKRPEDGIWMGYAAADAAVVLLNAIIGGTTPPPRVDVNLPTITEFDEVTVVTF